jgi:hypothetical protein
MNLGFTFCMCAAASAAAPPLLPLPLPVRLRRSASDHRRNQWCHFSTTAGLTGVV